MEPTLPVGSKDALHVPIVVAEAKQTLRVGERVVFKDNDLKEVWPVVGEDYHGIVNPFMGNDAYAGEKVYILVKPGLVEQVFHVFDLDVKASLKMKRAYEELERLQEEDPGCAGCYDIDEKGNVFRW